MLSLPISQFFTPYCACKTLVYVVVVVVVVIVVVVIIVAVVVVVVVRACVRACHSLNDGLPPDF